jgi:23S rRNA (uracil-5-)-methyltransferase RumA
MSYDEQLVWKNDLVLSCLDANGVIADEFLPIEPSVHTSGYRNKMEYSFGDEVKDGPLVLGLHKKKSYMSVIDTSGCSIVPKDFETIRRAVYGYALEKGHSFFHKRTHKGFLRNLALRRGEATGEIIVNLVTTGSISGSAPGGTDEERLDEVAFKELLLSLPLDNEIVGILHTFYSGKADTVACDELKVLYGRRYYNEILCGFDFRVDAFAFFQTNTAAASKMFKDAVQLVIDKAAADREKAGKAAGAGKPYKLLLDLYCGTGALTFALSLLAERTIGVEIVEESVLAAHENAAQIGLENVRFELGDALEVMERLPVIPDMVSVDPPRMGMHPKALKKLISYGLPRILYVSCNPKTFAENMAVMQTAGYRLTRVKPYDNFPHTKHVELVALVEKI